MVYPLLSSGSMTRYIPHWIVMAAMLLAAALSASCSSPTSPSQGSSTLTPDRMSGLWTLVAQQPPGQPEVAPPAGAIFSLEIADGRAAVRADCNRCNGQAAVGETTLVVGPNLACTKAFCPSAPFDDAFLRLLSGESVATIDGGTLLLRAERGVLRFRR